MLEVARRGVAACACVGHAYAVHYSTSLPASGLPPAPRRPRTLLPSSNSKRHAIEQELAARLDQLERNHQRAYLDPAIRAGELAADQCAIAHARDEAAWRRSTAAAWRDRGEKLIEQACADRFAAREASEVIAERPGRLHLRAGAVARAQERLGEIEACWPGCQLPGSRWTDLTVDNAAMSAACSSVEPEVRSRRADAARLEQAAAARE